MRVTRKEESIMNFPETQTATLGTRYRMKTNKTPHINRCFT